jgi:heme exporter protein D
VTYFAWYGTSVALIAFVIAATVVIERRKHLREQDIPIDEPSVEKRLNDAVATGRALLTEAAGLQPGDVGVDDNLLRRAADWVDEVSDRLAEHDERDMQKRWMNNPRWSQERPDPITREQWDRYVVSEIRERLALLSDFQHTTPPAVIMRFHDFAAQFRGWVRSQEIVAPPDMTATLGEDWEEQRIQEWSAGTISQADYERLVRPFTVRKAWLQQVRSDYQRNWRVDAERYLGWAVRGGHLPGADERLQLITAEDPREWDDFKRLAALFERVAERLGR